MYKWKMLLKSQNKSYNVNCCIYCKPIYFHCIDFHIHFFYFRDFKNFFLIVKSKKKKIIRGDKFHEYVNRTQKLIGLQKFFWIILYYMSTSTLLLWTQGAYNEYWLLPWCYILYNFSIMFYAFEAQQCCLIYIV